MPSFRASAPKPRGTIVLLHGRNEAIEKYFETIRDLTAMGFWVATFDWRGQGGSERLLSDPLKGYVRRFSDYELDLERFMEHVVLPDTRLSLLSVGAFDRRARGAFGGAGPDDPHRAHGADGAFRGARRASRSASAASPC